MEKRNTGPAGDPDSRTASAQEQARGDHQDQQEAAADGAFGRMFAGLTPREQRALKKPARADLN